MTYSIDFISTVISVSEKRKERWKYFTKVLRPDMIFEPFYAVMSDDLI